MKATNLEVDISDDLEDRVPNPRVLVPDELGKVLDASLRRRQDLQTKACDELAKLIKTLRSQATGAIALEASQQERAKFLGLKEKKKQYRICPICPWNR